MWIQCLLSDLLLQGQNWFFPVLGRGGGEGGVPPASFSGFVVLKHDTSSAIYEIWPFTTILSQTAAAANGAVTATEKVVVVKAQRWQCNSRWGKAVLPCGMEAHSFLKPIKLREGWKCSCCGSSESTAVWGCSVKPSVGTAGEGQGQSPLPNGARDWKASTGCGFLKILQMNEIQVTEL